MAARFPPKSGEPPEPQAGTPKRTALSVASALGRRAGTWFGRLFRTVVWEARKRTGAEEAAESRMMTGAQLMVAGVGIAVFGAIGVIAMVGNALDPETRQSEGFGSAIAGVVFYQLVAAFGLWARELGTRRKARDDATQIAERGVQDTIDTSQQTGRWYRKKFLIIPLALIPLLIPIGAFALTDQPTTTVPNVVGMRLDAAHEKLKEVALLTFTDADVIGPGRGVNLDHNWVVLSQLPAAGMTNVNTSTEMELAVGKIDDPEIRDRLPIDAPAMLELDAAEKAVADEQAAMADKAAESAAPTPTKAATKAPAQSQMTGYGATREAWDAKHVQAAGYTPGAAFLPMINGNQPKYSAVSGEPGERILSYSVNFPAGTDLALAKATVLREYPPGAKFGVQDTDEPECLIVEVRSPQVEAILDGSRPRITFFTSSEVSDTFVPNHVDDASMLLASADQTTDLGSC